MQESVVDEQKQLNLRKLKAEFTPAILKDGKLLFEKKSVVSCSSKHQKGSLLVSAHVKGQWDDSHACRLEFRLSDVSLVDSECDCPQKFECQHLAALFFFLEEHGVSEGCPCERQGEKQAASSPSKNSQKSDHKIESQEYAKAYALMRQLLIPSDVKDGQFAGVLLFSFSPIVVSGQRAWELQFAVKRQARGRTTLIQAPRQFLTALARLEPIFLGNERVVLGLDSFGEEVEQILARIRQEVHFIEKEKSEKAVKSAVFDDDGMGKVLSVCRKAACLPITQTVRAEFYLEGFEKSLQFSQDEASLRIKPCKLKEPFPHYLMGLAIQANSEEIPLSQARMIVSTTPGMLYKDCYYPFSPLVTRQRLHDLEALAQTVLPMHLLPCFIQETLPQLQSFLQVDPSDFSDVKLEDELKPLRLKLNLSYDAEMLTAKVLYEYGESILPHATKMLAEEVEEYLTNGKKLPSRRLSEEASLVSSLLNGFIWDEKAQSYQMTGDRSIVQFVAGSLKRFQDKITATPPHEIASRIKKGTTTIRLDLSLSDETKVMARLHVEGILEGVKTSDLKEAVLEGRTYLTRIASGKTSSKVLDPMDDFVLNEVDIVMLDLPFVHRVLPLLEELGFQKLSSTQTEIPLWALIAAQSLLVETDGCCIIVHDSIQKLLTQFHERKEDVSVEKLSENEEKFLQILRPYQKEGLLWLKLLKKYGLGGILADDMGLGKTLQTITLLSKVHLDEKSTIPTLVVCPTSLVENWKEEIMMFAPKLRVKLIQGTPEERKAIVSEPSSADVFVTSYGLLQKDVEGLEQSSFAYVILDEAQNIKNKETRTARAVKKLKSRMRLVLTGTPLENSLEDLWSLFDFLMPGFLGSWERFSSQHLKPSLLQKSSLDRLKMKIAPFVMRRMKQDVLSDLPSITRKTISCHLQEDQKELYHLCTSKAAEELHKLVEKEGFEKSKMHVLATITRLKQICCHPKLIHEKTTKSAKYELFWELLTSLIASKRRVVVFSQFTSMLNIIREDLEAKEIRYLYLDGATRNRQGTVKEFNEDSECAVFLVSLRAGGVGLNLVGADSVIHYDLWWNPAVENQATDRVWRLGQKLPVTSYKLVTKGTVEERIVSLQDQKKELLGDLVLSEEDVLSRLKWEEVLELLKL